MTEPPTKEQLDECQIQLVKYGTLPASTIAVLLLDAREVARLRVELENAKGLIQHDNRVIDELRAEVARLVEALQHLKGRLSFSCSQCDAIAALLAEYDRKVPWCG